MIRRRISGGLFRNIAYKKEIIHAFVKLNQNNKNFAKSVAQSFIV